MTTNSLKQTAAIGQSIWLDYLHRRALSNGETAALINDGGVTGITSNPSIFEKAIGGDELYNVAIERLMNERPRSAMELYEKLATADIQVAADLLRSVYERCHRRDGYVSLEVSPHLAHDGPATIAEAKRLWRLIDRPNIMIKVPGTPAGVTACEELIAAGLNINVTLLFSVQAYQAIAEAYRRGLSRYAAGGGDLSTVASVASFFVSRVDSAIDKLLKKSTPPLSTELISRLAGHGAIANAKVAYAHFQELITRPEWRALAAKGAQPQRLLWASTSTKDPAYPELLYAEGLIGPDTVDTMPPATYQTFRQHGKVESTLSQGLPEAKETLTLLASAGISLAAVTDKLLEEGLVLFQDAFDKLLASVERRRSAFVQ